MQECMAAIRIWVAFAKIACLQPHHLGSPALTPLQNKGDLVEANGIEITRFTTKQSYVLEQKL